ncbi:MAG: hypothetical protein ACOCV2_00895 [Persicimonas sp.]
MGLRNWWCWVGLLLVSSMVSVGCGGGEMCAEGTCASGLCDSETGECVNPESCEDDRECLAGYACGEEGECEAVESCREDGDCAVGQCDGGACVNPDECEADEECLERTFCGPDGVCEQDPCNAIECRRGVCKRGTDRCVSADACTRETELVDCVRGERCVDGVCVEEERYCEERACERGECSYEEGGCVNPEVCSEDGDCREGYFCREDTCELDLCSASEIDCGEDGVCEPASGTCANADECEDDTECRPGYRCVDRECLREESACGDGDGHGGCTGDQRCEIEDQTARCREPEQCERSDECEEGGQCTGERCIEQVSCADDSFEPNDEAAEATDWHEASSDGRLRGTICADDTDVFEVDTEEFLGDADRGTLIIDLETPERDHGLGRIEATLTDVNGSEETASTGDGGEEGRLRFEQNLSIVDQGTYQLELEADGDIEPAGVGYELSITVRPAGDEDVCDETRRISDGQRVSGLQDDVVPARYRSTCATVDEEAGETVYEYRAESAERVTFSLTSERTEVGEGTDFSISLRERCRQDGSELACADANGTGGDEELTAAVEPGRYYLLVQGEQREVVGDHRLLVETERAACGAGSDYCESADVSLVCVDQGAGFDRHECEQGCRPTSGRCIEP